MSQLAGTGGEGTCLSRASGEISPPIRLLVVSLEKQYLTHRCVFGTHDYLASPACRASHGLNFLRVTKQAFAGYESGLQRRCLSHIFALFSGDACCLLRKSGHGVPLQADIAVGTMMKKDQERFPERREELLNLLGVDPNWRMHQVCLRMAVETAQ